MTTTPTAWNGLTQADTGGVDDSDPDVVALASGGYLISWEADGPGGGLRGQRYDALGEKVGGILDLDHRTGDSFDAVMASIGNGGIAVAFENSGGGGQIIVQRYDKTLSSFHTDVIGTGFSPAIAGFKDGGYVVAEEVGTDTYVRFVSASGSVGAAIGIETGMNTSAAATVAALSNGNVAVAYQDIAGLDNNIRFRILDRNGSDVVIDTAVAGGADALGQEYNPDVAGLKGGGFVVAWEDGDGDSDGGGIRATIYDKAGQVVSADFQVNTTETGGQFEPSVTPLSDGTFIIGWVDGETDLPRAQRFDASGNAVGAEFAINAAANTDSAAQAVELRDGRVAFVVPAHVGTDFVIDTQIFDPRTNPIVGTHDADTLTARISGSTIRGLAGDDVLFGSLHGDKLVGGRGADRMHAGGDDANDLFVFASKHDSGHGKKSGWDRLYDFDAHQKHEAKSDKIDLSDIDADKHQKHDQEFRFVDHFSKAQGGAPDGEVTVESAGKNLKVLVDVNGDKDADMILLVMHVQDLHKADFLL